MVFFTGALRGQEKTEENMEQYPIDFVLMWVDGDDPQWKKTKCEYWNREFPLQSMGDDAVRFRDWGLLRFWFRAVERYAPWVNRIYFVTDGQRPDWLNTAHPKLTLVSHRDYMDAEILPTFNSGVIESNLHRIQGLSEHFVLFNDDMLLNGPVMPDSFFHKGLPRDVAIHGPSRNYIYRNVWEHSLFSMMNLVNAHFNLRKSMLRHPGKWIHPAYGIGSLDNLLMFRFGAFSWIQMHHLPAAHRKSVMEEVWQTCGTELREASKNRFRSPFDVTQYLFRWWAIAKGEFIPTSPKAFGRKLEVGEDMQLLRQVIMDESIRTVCYQDVETLTDYADRRSALQALLAQKLPRCSAFERYDRTTGE